MPVQIKITGAEQCRALGRDLRAAGLEGKQLRRELLAAMRVAARPMVDAAKKSARESLPHRGGLNEFIASSRFSVRNGLVGSKAGTRIVARKAGGSHGQHDLEAMDDGEFRHPVFGGPAWAPQQVAPGWFTRPLKEAAPVVVAALDAAMALTAKQIARGRK